MIAGPLWGAIADFLRLHRWLLPLSMLATLPALTLLWHAQTFAAFLASVTAYAFFLAPITPLADHAVITLLEQNRYDYGRFRLWGSVGFGAMAWIAGEMIEAFGKGAAFLLALGLMAVGAAVASRLSAPRPTPSEPLRHSLRRMAGDVRRLSFLAAAFLTGIGFAVLNNYLVLYLKALGASEGLLGFLVGAASLSELPFFFLSARLLRKWSPRLLLLASFALLALRCLLTSFLRNPRAALSVQLLQGPTFSAGWAAGVAYASESAPPGLGASAQSAFGAAQFGLAGMVGALVGGQVYGSLGPPALFLVTSVVVFSGLLLFALGGARAPQARTA